MSRRDFLRIAAIGGALTLGGLVLEGYQMSDIENVERSFGVKIFSPASPVVLTGEPNQIIEGFGKVGNSLQLGNKGASLQPWSRPDVALLSYCLEKVPFGFYQSTFGPAIFARLEALRYSAVCFCSPSEEIFNQSSERGLPPRIVFNAEKVNFPDARYAVKATVHEMTHFYLEQYSQFSTRPDELGEDHKFITNQKLALVLESIGVPFDTRYDNTRVWMLNAKLMDRFAGYVSYETRDDGSVDINTVHISNPDILTDENHLGYGASRVPEFVPTASEFYVVHGKPHFVQTYEKALGHEDAQKLYAALKTEIFSGKEY